MNTKQALSSGQVSEKEYQEMAEALKKATMEMDMLIHTVNGGTARLAVDDGLRIITASEGYYRMIGYTEAETLKPPLYGKSINLVLPQDIPKVTAALQKLARNESASASLRIRKKDGSVAWNEAYCAQIDTSGEERSIDVFFIDITSAKNTEIEFKNLLDRIPAGVVRAVIGADIRVEYANDEFYRQIGYSREEFAGPALQNQYLRIVYPGDRAELLKRAVDYASSDRKPIALNYRITTKSGELRWMRATASRLSKPDEPDRIIQGVLTDITEEHDRIQAIAINEKRYRIIAEQTRDTVFDWDLTSDHIQFSPVYEKMFGFMPPDNLPIQRLLEYDIIFEEDKPRVKKMIDAVLGGAPRAEADYRAKRADGSYIWCRNRVTTIFDEDDNPLRAVGILSDIDEYVKKTEILQEQAERDSLTGLLNRMTFQRQTEQLLQEDPNRRHAFFLLDIDCFKSANDTYGHAIGDEILQEVARLLVKRFRTTDLLARMGGDEFAGFLPSLSSMGSVVEKVEALCQNGVRLKSGQFVSISLGMAFYPEDGGGFQALYEHADTALYEAKKRGGESCLYAPSRE